MVSEVVEARLTEALTQFRLAPQIKPHALVEAKNRLEQLDTKAILDLIKRVDLCETTVQIELDIDKVSFLIQTEISKLDLELLRIEEPVALRKRTNGTKLTWVGYKGEPNHALIRAIVTAQAWVEEIKAGRSVSDIIQAHNIPEGMNGVREGITLSDKAMQALDRLKSLEGGNAKKLVKRHLTGWP